MFADRLNSDADLPRFSRVGWGIDAGHRVVPRGLEFRLAAKDGARAGREGYTILELVLVLAILATAMVAVAPSLSGFAAGRRAEETAARFLSLTNWARSQAISDGVPYELVIDGQSGKWWLRIVDDSPTQEVAGPFGRKYSAMEDVRLESDIATVDGEQVIHFDPSGRSSVGTVRFTGPRSVVAVTCDAPLERFRILNGSEVLP